MKCSRCGKQRSAESLPRDQILIQYRSTITDPAVKIFETILRSIPTLENHHNLDEVLQYEVQVEECRKNTDYQKLAVIDTFKKLKSEYLHSNRAKNITLDNDQEAETNAMMVLEEQYLNGLEQKLVSSHANICAHAKRITNFSKLIKELDEKLKTSYSHRHHQVCEELSIIATNAFTGRGSDFLKDLEKQSIFSGKLHMNSSQKHQISNQKEASPKLEEFFSKLEKGNTNKAMPELTVITKKPLKAKFGFYGKYPLYLLRQRKILLNIQIDGKKIDNIIKKCSFVFYDDDNQGFKVELIYEESDTKCLIFGMTSHEAILETFTIQKHMLAEMRRTFSTKATLHFGSSEFNVFEFVFLLNEIKSKIYSYGAASSKIDQQI